MSFDLYFYKRKDSTLTQEMMKEYLSELFPMEEEVARDEWVYGNPDTMVQFYFTLTDDSPTEVVDEEDALFEPMGFSCHVPFMRAGYWGHEAFPFIDGVIEDLDLFVIDPQDEVNVGRPIKYPKGHLEQEWLELNDRVCRNYSQEMGIDFMPYEKSFQIWNYLYQKNDLEAMLSEDIYVPGIFVFKSNEDSLLCTASIWPQGVPLLLPKVDMVIALKEDGEDGVIMYDALMEEFGRCFEDYEHEVPGLKILSTHNAELVKDKFNALPLTMDINTFGTNVPLDKIVNARTIVDRTE